MPLIIPSNSISAGGYEVDNSLRFNSGSSDYLNRTMSSSGSSRTTFTFSTWFKTSVSGSTISLFGSGDASSFFRIRIGTTGRLSFEDYYPDAYNLRWSAPATGLLLRDSSAWYHLVCAIDTTQASSGDRVKIYVNGENITSLFTATNSPSLNATFQINNDNPTYVGYEPFGTEYFDGYMAEVCFIDGQQLDATSFGEFDEDSGIWKPIDVSELTFGTNGFYLDFENSGSLGADVSGNGNNFTVNNLTAIDQSTDTCTNNFATWNRLIPPTFTNHNLLDGNLTVEGETSSQNTAFSTFAVSSGRWFCEMKLTVEGNATSSVPNFGIASTADFKHADSEAYYESSGTNIYAGRVNSAQINRNGSDSGTDLSDTPDVGDIMGLALDLDSGTKTLKFYLNGSLVGTVNINTDEYCFICAVKEDNNKATVQGNFGGTNTYTVSSGNADGNGYGNFEYAVPSGYLSLCTKNLSEVLG